jgi:hypothetical protein
MHKEVMKALLKFQRAMGAEGTAVGLAGKTQHIHKIINR